MLCYILTLIYRYTDCYELKRAQLSASTIPEYGMSSTQAFRMVDQPHDSHIKPFFSPKTVLGSSLTRLCISWVVLGRLGMSCAFLGRCQAQDLRERSSIVTWGSGQRLRHEMTSF